MAETNSLTESMQKVLGTTANVGQTSTYTPPDPFAAYSAPAATAAATPAAAAPAYADDPYASFYGLSTQQQKAAQRRPQLAKSQYGIAAPPAGYVRPANVAPAAPYTPQRQGITYNVYGAEGMANQAAQAAYDSTLQTGSMISPEQWDQNSAAYQRAAYDNSVAAIGPGGGVGAPVSILSRSASGAPVYDIFTKPSSELQAQANDAAEQAYKESVRSYTGPFRTMAPEQRQFFQGAYQAPLLPDSVYWTK